MITGQAEVRPLAAGDHGVWLPLWRGYIRAC